jgi:hypothetical protein
MESIYASKSRWEKNQCHGGNSLHRRAVAQRSRGDLGRTLSKFTTGFCVLLGYNIVYLALLLPKYLRPYCRMNNVEIVILTA